jgi:hypothetical protein
MDGGSATRADMRRLPSVHGPQLDGKTYLECCAVTNPRLEMNLSLEDAAKLPDDG